MIRQFAGPDGKLWELIKAGLRFGTRPRAPSGILFRDNYYKSPESDLDAELFRDVETAFDRHYPKLAEEAWIENHSADEASAFIDWVASMLVRTPLFAESAGVHIAQHYPSLPKDAAATGSMYLNVLRLESFKMWRAHLARPGLRWKCRLLPNDDELVITDTPVFLIPTDAADERAFVVPLSRRRILVGGSPTRLEPFAAWRSADFNFWLAGWAHSSVFAGSQSTLVAVASALQSCPCDRVRQPLFGHLEYISRTERPASKVPDLLGRMFDAKFGKSVYL